MSPFVVFSLLVCFQAYVAQEVFGQCLGSGMLPSGFSSNYAYNSGSCACDRGHGFANTLGNGYGWSAAEAVGAYGGAGTGDLDVAAELPVAGTTTVTGQVPIIGAVQFAGDVPAGGVVSIYGKCGCDCNGAPLFYDKCFS